MSEFKSWRSFKIFCEEVRRSTRYFRSAESQEFLDALLETCHKREIVMSTGGELWRAQLGCDWRPEEDGDETYAEPEPYAPDRLKPAPEHVGDGRANPRRIAYFYAASDIDTAIAEVRPWVGAFVSVGKFETVQSLRLIDCRSDTHYKFQIFHVDHEPSPERRESEIWEQINRAFSQPYGPSYESIGYIPTQVIAEFFRVNGYDGLIYASSLGPETNCCLFDSNKVRQLSGHVFRADAISYVYSEAGYAYYCNEITASATE